MTSPDEFQGAADPPGGERIGTPLAPTFEIIG